MTSPALRWPYESLRAPGPGIIIGQSRIMRPVSPLSRAQAGLQLELEVAANLKLDSELELDSEAGSLAALPVVTTQPGSLSLSAWQARPGPGGPGPSLSLRPR